MIRRIVLVASREFVATVRSKGFIVGVLGMPILVLLLVVLVPRMLSSRGPAVSGQVEVIDPTSAVAAELGKALDPAAIASRRAPTPVRGAGPIPHLTVVAKATADIQSEKRWLIQPGKPDVRHIALVVIHPDAVVRSASNPTYGTYDLYLAAQVDDNSQWVIREALREALVAARLKSAGFDREAIGAATSVEGPAATVVTASGERPVRAGFAMMLPFLSGVLLFVGVITGGQILLTSTVEEKSSRVVEVLLAAVAPVELMAGKLAGQLGVSLLTLSVYLGMGILLLTQYSLAGVLEPSLLGYFLVFFLLTYLVYGALLLAVGAAINQVAEAQALLGPIMLLMLVPYALTPVIGRAPNAPLSVVLSFIPPMNSFAILARLASSTPPPLWQVLTSMLSGVLGVMLAVWFAAKVFKIGLLMQGKPPNFATLIRWARQA